MSKKTKKRKNAQHQCPIIGPLMGEDSTSGYFKD